MNQQSFGRIVKLRVFATVIGTESGAPKISYDQGYTEFSSVQPDGSAGYRIKGKCVQVQPTVGFNTNQITLSIYNLGPDSRALIQSKVGTKIAIFAGYGDNIKQIALGDVLWANTHKESDTSYVTDIIAGDSHFALTNGEVDICFKGPVSFKQVVQALLDALAKQNIFLSTPIDNIPDGGYNNGITLNRSPFVELSDICKKMGMSFNIIGGGVFILPLGQDNGSPILEISNDTGMIGIPEVQPPGIIGVQQPTVPVSPENDVSFKHLLRADLTLSQRVRIKSKFINGEYVIGRNVFDFDSWSGPFYNECQAFKVQSSGV